MDQESACGVDKQSKNLTAQKEELKNPIEEQEQSNTVKDGTIRHIY